MQTSQLMKPLRIGALLVGAAMLTNCASIPRSAVPESQFSTLSCAELSKEQQAAQETKSVAEQAKSDSWHAVLPFVVAARYADASSATTEAQKRLDLLAEQSKRRGCTS